MTLWLETIRSEMDMLEDDTMLGPNITVREGEDVIYTITEEELRKLYCLARQYNYRADRASTEEGYAQSEERQKELHNEHMRLENRCRVLSALFWIELRSYLEFDGPDTIGLRRGWLVVKGQEQERDPFFARWLGMQ